MGIKGDKYWVLDKRGSWLQHGVINATTGMGLILLAPLFVFIGMSYIPGSQFRNVWNAIVTVLYFCSFVFMSYYILGSIFQTSVNLWLVAAGWCSLVVLYGSGALLGLLGLLPVQAYLGSLLFFALVALALYSLLFSMVLRHKAPLLRAYSFMEKGRVVLVTICLLPITRIAHDLLFKFSMRGDDLQSFMTYFALSP